jgi:hypothetical protein
MTAIFANEDVERRRSRRTRQRQETINDVLWVPIADDEHRDLKGEVCRQPTRTVRLASLQPGRHGASAPTIQFIIYFYIFK